MSQDDRSSESINSGPNVRDWSQAAVETDSSSMAGSGENAAIFQGIACSSILILLLPASLFVNYDAQARPADTNAVGEV